MNKSDLVSVMIGLFAREMIQYHFVIQNGAQAPVMAHYLSIAVYSCAFD